MFDDYMVDENYLDSALSPKHIFYKGDQIISIVLSYHTWTFLHTVFLEGRQPHRKKAIFFTLALIE